jgi:hypothetical protein
VPETNLTRKRGVALALSVPAMYSGEEESGPFEGAPVVSEAVASAELDPVVGSTLASALALKMPTAASTAAPRTALAVHFLSVRATTVLPPL